MPTEGGPGPYQPLDCPRCGELITIPEDTPLMGDGFPVTLRCGECGEIERGEFTGIGWHAKYLEMLEEWGEEMIRLQGGLRG